MDLEAHYDKVAQEIASNAMVLATTAWMVKPKLVYTKKQGFGLMEEAERRNDDRQYKI